MSSSLCHASHGFCHERESRYTLREDSALCVLCDDVFLSQRGFAEEDKVVLMWRRPLCAGWDPKYTAVVLG